MKKRERTMLMLTLMVGALAACAPGRDGETGGDDNVGGVSVDLTDAPVDARCAVITGTVAGGTPVSRTFSLSPGQTGAFVVTGFPTGAVTLTEQVFNLPCAMVTPTTPPSWASPPVMVTLNAGVNVNVTFTLQRVDAGGVVTATSSFPAPPNSITELTVPLMMGSARSTPSGIVTGPDDLLWFTDGAQNAIGKMSLDGTTTLFPLPVTQSGLTRIVTGSDGNLWFIEQRALERGGVLGRITPLGIITEFPLPGSPHLLFAIAAGRDGNLWLTDFVANAVWKATTGGQLTELKLPMPNSGPEGIAVGSDNNIWITEGEGSRIARLTPAGTFTEFTLPSMGAFPDGIVGGPDGNLWFVERGSNRVGRITTAGSIAEFLVPTALAGLSQITSGPDGNLWFTETGPGKVVRLTTAGVMTEFALPNNAADPSGITTGPDGAVWFTEPSAGHIARIRP